MAQWPDLSAYVGSLKLSKRQAHPFIGTPRLSVTRIIAAIADGMAAADFTVTGLAKALPYSWAEQERKIGLHSQ